jgi:hypothetical protein
MRMTIIIAIAAILTPAALTAHPAAAPGFANATAATDLSAAKKKKAKKKTEENMKAAPSAPPSGTKY